MSVSNFPNDFDTDLELPRVDKEVSEISGDAINALRDAIFNIQKNIGLSAQGSKSSLADLISVSIDSNGKLKSAALSEVGVVTLPISNSQIGDNAGIEESKLDLNQPTQVLKNSISSLQTDVTGVQNGLLILESNFNNHITGKGSFHDGYQIKINTGTQFGLSGLTASTVGGALNEIVALLTGGDETVTPHLDLSLPINIRHKASSISVDSSNFTLVDLSTANAQEAFENIEQEIIDQQIKHIDSFHANGILKEINSGELFNSRQKKADNLSASYTKNTTVVTIPSISGSFASLKIKPGDILEVIGSVLDAGTYKIDALGPLLATEALGALPPLNSDQLSVFHVFESSDSVSVNIYKAASVSSETAPLACAARHSETLVDTLSVLNPNAAHVVSLGFNGAIINGDGYDISIEVGLGNGHIRPLTITNLNRDRLSVGQSEVVDTQSVAERMSAFF